MDFECVNIKVSHWKQMKRTGALELGELASTPHSNYISVTDWFELLATEVLYGKAAL